MGFADKLSNITEAKWYKVMMPKLYGWGASLVIIGALFKIENWPFASVFLTIAYAFSVLTIFYAPLSLTASSRYTVIVFGMVFGYLILNEVPSTNMIIGALIISISGLFVINREKKLGKID